MNSSSSRLPSLFLQEWNKFRQNKVQTHQDVHGKWYFGIALLFPRTKTWSLNYYRFWSIWTQIYHFLSEKWSKILCPNDFRSWKLLSPVQSVEDFLSPFGGLFFWESLQTNENFEFQPTKYLLSCRRMSDLNSIHEAEYLDHLIKINLPRRILIVHPERPPSSIKLVHSFFSTSYENDQGTNQVQTLPKSLRTQVLTALASNFGLVGLVQYAW